MERISIPPYDLSLLLNVRSTCEIVEHRRKFYHVGYVDYDKELPANIQIVPDKELMPAYEADYNEMKENFIYGKPLAFGELMEKLNSLQERYRKIS